MSTARKTQRGERFKSLQELIEWTDRGYWIYFREKPTHPSWALGWQLRMIKRSIRDEYLFECLDLAGNPYSSSSLLALSRDLDLTDAELQLLSEADDEKVAAARKFLSSKRESQWAI